MVLRFGAAITAAVLFVCSGSRGGYTRTALPRGSSPPRANNAVGPRSNHPKLYVVNAGNSTVSVFDLVNTSSAPTVITGALTPIIGGGLRGPSGVALATSGRLYVANSAANSVSVFDTTLGNAPLQPITGGSLNFPYGVAVR